jgi:electron transport complex protein RnfD
MTRTTTRTTPRIMALVALCLVPGAVASTLFFGTGVLVNLVVAVLTAAAVEAAVARVRGQTPGALLRDGSAWVTALLLALALPPGVSMTIVATAVAIALLLGKAVYGGLGANPFNPAMVGYAAVLVSFPAALAVWPDLTLGAVDGSTAATPLDVLKHRGGATVADVWSAANGFGSVAGVGWEWVNAAYFAGGVVLVYLRVADWRIPVSMLGTLTLLATIAYDAGSSGSHGSPSFHLFSGATMLGAFFIATDPVTCPPDARGRALFGALIGALVWILRTESAYPDGVAFAVLLANAAAPLIAHATARARARDAGAAS